MDASKLGKSSSSEDYWNPDLVESVAAEVKQVESVAADVNAEVTKGVTAKVTAEVSAEVTAEVTKVGVPAEVTKGVTAEVTKGVTAKVTKVGVPAEITAVNTRRDPFNMGPGPCFD